MAGLTNSVLYLASSFWQLLLDVFSVNLLWQKKFSPPSSETAARVQGINSLLRKERVSDSAIDLVSDLPITEDLLAVTDLSGYNLLQLAVMREDTQTVRWLLRLGFDPDICNCSSAIQIAARNGHQDIVQVLIEAGAKVDKQRGMCYVKPHVPIMFRANYLGLSPHPVYECNSRKKTPLQCAVDGDHVNIVKILYPVLAQKLYDETPPSELMHYACRVGSLKVMQHLVGEWPELAETPDSNGHTPLLLAVPWGQSHTQFLIDSGADLRQRSSLGETVLHRLFRNTKDGYYSIYNTTKFLLTSGMEEDVNVQDYKGETALHNLVGHVSFVLKGGSNFGEEPDDMVQSDYQQEVVECLDLLLSYNADVSVINNQNHQPLSKLMHFAFVTCYPREPHPCIELDPDDHYVNNFDSLNKALQVLLKHGADPNVQCGAGHTSLVLLLQCFLYGSPECCCSQSAKFLNCLETLLSHGAKVNFVTSSEATCSTLLAKIGQRCLQLGREGRRNDVTLQDEFSELLNDCLKLMLRYGLNPNHISTKKSSHLQGGTGNALIEFVRLAEYAAVPRDLAAIHKWIQTLMQWGADPDIEPYPSHPIICHSQSSIFLKKQASQPVSHYIHEAKELKSMFAEGHAMDLLLLFYSTMDHQILYECLRSAKFMSRFHPMGATGQDFLRALNKLTDNPRTLKSTVRVVIYKALNRSLAEKVPELPLPNPLKRYLLEIEL